MKNLTLFFVLTISLSLFPVNFNNSNEMLVFLKKFIPEFPVILEAGGHHGEDTCKMKMVWPQAEMHVFEPLPSSYEKLLKATHSLSSVTCYPYALANFSGVTNFYIDIPNSGASSIGFPVEFNKQEFDQIPIQVSCITLNEWAAMNKISRIDFMWLDMEGYELYALQNALNILSSVSAIYTEISFELIRENSCLYDDLKAFIEKQGFVEVWKRSWSSRQGDALFMRKDLFDVM